MRKEKGITLISLVVTIIVILILLLVTINLTLNGKIFDYAKDAGQKTEVAQEQEKDWTSIETGLETDALISQYKGENPDLQKLRKYYLDGDELAIPDAAQSITEIAPDRGWEDDDFKIIEYNNSTYRITYEYNENTDTMIATTIEELTEEVALGYTIMANGALINSSKSSVIYNSNNTNYIISLAEGHRPENVITVNQDETIVVIDPKYNHDYEGEHVEQAGYIKFTPQSGQTWFNWASTTDDANLIVYDNTTFKQLITTVNGQTDKTIKFIYATGDARENRHMSTLKGNNVACTSDSVINPNTIYEFQSVQY